MDLTTFSPNTKIKSAEVNDNFTDIIDAINSGWVPANSTETWTYASATTFTVVGDVTGIYAKGDKLRLKQGGDYKYYYVISASYSAPNTTVTVVGDSSSPLANATITDNYYSKFSNPLNFPTWFAFSPTYSASGSMTFTSVSTDYARFRIDGHLVTVQVYATGTTGGSASNNLRITAPVTADTSNQPHQGFGYVSNAAAADGAAVYMNTTTSISVARKDFSNYSLSANTGPRITIIYGMA